MLLGNAGIVTSVASLLVTFITPDASTSTITAKIAFLVFGVSLLWLVSYSQFVDRWLSRIIEWALGRMTNLETTDFAGLLRLSGDYSVSELAVRSDDWLADKSLSETRLRDEGVVVLGVQRRDGSFVGVPDGRTKVLPEDRLVLYGTSERLNDLDQRTHGVSGDVAHDRAVQDARAQKEKQHDVATRTEQPGASDEETEI
jgi:hypothetical protein